MICPTPWKRRYPDRVEALADRTDRAQKAFRCDGCQGWHLRGHATPGFHRGGRS